MTNTYEPIPEYPRDEVEQALARNDPEELLRVVIGVALYEEDLGYSQQLCIRLSSHEHFNVRGNAVLGFGHLARRFRTLNKTLVKPIIERSLRDPSDYVRGQAVDAADDVAHFLKWKIEGLEEG